MAIGQTSAMFFGDRITGLTNIGRALRPGGRLALLTWQPVATNEWILDFSTAMAAGRDLPPPPPDAPGPFTLAHPDVVRTALDTAGFSDVELQAQRAPMWFGHDADDAYQLVSGLLAWMLDGLDDTSRAGALDALRNTIAAHETRDGVLYESAAWIIAARRP